MTETHTLQAGSGDAFVAAAERALASGDLNGISNQELTRQDRY
jgi:hypothetical protein